MAEMMPPRLGRVLLGLLHSTPMSGYQIRKLFATTPMEAFSDSPGSIYPALRRLEREGLVSGRNEPAHSRRPRRVFALTEAGRDTLHRWLEEPVTLEDVKHRSDDLILRFAFMPALVGNERTLRFLAEWEAGLRQHLLSLERYIEEVSGQMPIGGRLALESGIGASRAQLRWTQHAARALRAADGERGRS